MSVAERSTRTPASAAPTLLCGWGRTSHSWCEVSVPRSDAIALPEGHYYLADLIGIRVESTNGRALGRIADVLRTGSNDVYVVRGSAGELLVPGTQDAVAELNVPDRRLVVEAWILEPER